MGDDGAAGLLDMRTAGLLEMRTAGLLEMRTAGLLEMRTAGLLDMRTAGLLEMRTADARTLGQDEASCVVYGMPKEAVKRGAVERSVALSAVAREIQNYGASA